MITSVEQMRLGVDRTQSLEVLPAVSPTMVRPIFWEPKILSVHKMWITTSKCKLLSCCVLQVPETRRTVCLIRWKCSFIRLCVYCYQPGSFSQPGYRDGLGVNLEDAGPHGVQSIMVGTKPLPFACRRSLQWFSYVENAPKMNNKFTKNNLGVTITLQINVKTVSSLHYLPRVLSASSSQAADSV
jgi:hypothetical protein